MDTVITASCNCGAVKFSASSDPLIQFVCHCTHCQTATGNAFAELVFFKLKRTAITGDLRKQQFVADSGSRTQRHYCIHCNDLMFDQSEGFAGIIGVMRERITSDFIFTPVSHVWVQSKKRMSLFQTA